jgi:hypothetical protein
MDEKFINITIEAGFPGHGQSSLDRAFEIILFMALKIHGTTKGVRNYAHNALEFHKLGRGRVF